MPLLRLAVPVAAQLQVEACQPESLARSGSVPVSAASDLPHGGPGPLRQCHSQAGSLAGSGGESDSRAQPESRSVTVTRTVTRRSPPESVTGHWHCQWQPEPASDVGTTRITRCH